MKHFFSDDVQKMEKLDEKEQSEKDSSTKSFVILGLIFLASLIAIAVIYFSFPELEM